MHFESQFCILVKLFIFLVCICSAPPGLSGESFVRDPGAQCLSAQFKRHDKNLLFAYVKTKAQISSAQHT